MVEVSPGIKIVTRALAEDRIEDIFCEREGFIYLPYRTPSPGKTDIVEMIRLIYKDRSVPFDIKIERYENRLVRAAERYAGLDNVAAAIMLEFFRRSKCEYCFLFSFDNIANILRESIKEWQCELSFDPSDIGIDGPRLEHLRRMNRSIQELGGPSIIPSDLALPPVNTRR